MDLVISQGKPKFETHEVDPPKKYKWKTKKRLKVQRKREKEKRRAANKKDPRLLRVKGKKKQKFSNAEERIKHKLEKVRQLEPRILFRSILLMVSLFYGIITNVLSKICYFQKKKNDFRSISSFLYRRFQKQM